VCGCQTSDADLLEFFNCPLNPVGRSIDEVHPADNGVDGAIVGQLPDVT
jgi:hypothetical protein